MPLSGPEHPPSSQLLRATVRGVDVLNLEPTFLLQLEIMNLFKKDYISGWHTEKGALLLWSHGDPFSALLLCSHPCPPGPLLSLFLVSFSLLWPHHMSYFSLLCFSPFF